MMHQAAPAPSEGVRPARAPAALRIIRAAWPWLVAALPWAVLINYLRLEWSANEQYSYGFVVPLLSLYLWAQLWPTRPQPAPVRPTWPLIAAAIPGALLVAPLLLFVEASPEWRIIGWLLALCTTGLTALLVLHRGGWPWLRHFAFPLLFIFAAVPWPTSMEYKIMIPLMQGDAAAAVEILNWCGVPAVQHQNVIQLPNTMVGVDEACSGIRSLQTSLMIALFVGEWLQLRLLRRFVLLGAALLLTYVFNLGRTLILVSLSAAWGDDMLHRWHDTVGLGVLALSLGGLWLLAVLIRDRRATEPPPAPDQPLRPPGPWPHRFLAVLGLWLVAAIAGTQLWFDSHEGGPAAGQRWSIAWPTQLPTYQSVQIPVEARTSLMYSAEKSSAATWQNLDTASLWLGYFMRWDAGRETSILASTHHPDVCLPATGKPLVADHGTENFAAAGTTLPVQIYQFNDGGQPLFVFYCLASDNGFTSADAASAAATSTGSSGLWPTLRRILLPFTPASDLDFRLHAIARGQRNQGQQVLEIGLWGCRTLADARKAFARELPQLLHPLPARR